MSPARRSLRPALLLTTALLLSSCGIPETGVVEAGEPATGIRPALVLYFVGKGTPLAVRRQDFGPVDIETAVQSVLRGPEPVELRKGLTTELPLLAATPTVRTDGARVTIELPLDTEPLTETAVAQLTCTAAAARLVMAPDTDIASTKVTVTARGAWRTEGSAERCPSVTSDG